jgi:hypothetical protein
MPLHIDIRVNDSLLSTLHIGRFSGGTGKDDNNVYLIVDGKEPTNIDDWVMRGTEFKHRYGDGAEVCVMKGIRALRGDGEQIARS